MYNNEVEIPMDIYDSSSELVIIIPLGGVIRETIQIYLEKTTLTISGNRKKPELKEGFIPLQEECFWGEFSKDIELPQNVYFDKIESNLTKENILTIIVPKVIIPEKMKLEVNNIS